MTPETTTSPDARAAVKQATLPGCDRVFAERAVRKLASIRRAILRQTNGGIQDLEVDLQSSAVRLRGRCSSFYCKQVAQQSAMLLMVDGEQLVNAIEVSPPR